MAAQANGAHCIPAFYVDKVLAAPDVQLSPEGQKRAECLASTLKDAGIKQIYVTDVTRTQQTAAPLAKALKIKPQFFPPKP